MQSAFLFTSRKYFLKKIPIFKKNLLQMVCHSQNINQYVEFIYSVELLIIQPIALVYSDINRHLIYTVY